MADNTSRYAAKFPELTPRPIAAQFMADNVIALFELTVQGTEMVVVSEQHYKLVPSSEITPQDKKIYSRMSQQ